MGAKRNKQLEGYMESNADWMKFNGDDFPLFALDNIGSNNADDLMGDAFDENEVDHDSDSDSDEEEAVVHMDGTDEEEEKKESEYEYELPQDAFAKLTQSIDDI